MISWFITHEKSVAHGNHHLYFQIMVLEWLSYSHWLRMNQPKNITAITWRWRRKNSPVSDLLPLFPFPTSQSWSERSQWYFPDLGRDYSTWFFVQKNTFHQFFISFLLVHGTPLCNQWQYHISDITPPSQIIIFSLLPVSWYFDIKSKT